MQKKKKQKEWERRKANKFLFLRWHHPCAICHWKIENKNEMSFCPCNKYAKYHFSFSRIQTIVLSYQPSNLMHCILFIAKNKVFFFFLLLRNEINDYSISTDVQFCIKSSNKWTTNKTKYALFYSFHSDFCFPWNERNHLFSLLRSWNEQEWLGISFSLLFMKPKENRILKLHIIFFYFFFSHFIHFLLSHSIQYLFRNWQK